MNLRSLPLSVLLVLLLSGCATSYGPANIWGIGYKDAPLDDDRSYTVTYKGDNIMEPEKVAMYCLYRCAELTALKGYDYFVVLQDNEYATRSGFSQTDLSSKASVTPDPLGKGVTGEASSSISSKNYVMTSHTITRRIRMYKGEKPEENPNAYNARGLLKNLRETVGAEEIIQ